MVGVFSELTFFDKLTFWRLTISPSIIFKEVHAVKHEPILDNNFKQLYCF